jgi:hypothetical protein
MGIYAWATTNGPHIAPIAGGYVAQMYMVNLTYGSPLFAVTGSFICAKFFKFDLHQTGRFLGVPLTVGCLTGEFSAGWVSDWILNAYAKRHDGYRKVEVCLWLLPLTTMCAIGIATFGYCIQHHSRGSRLRFAWP